jgi:hypothetical protein
LDRKAPLGQMVCKVRQEQMVLLGRKDLLVIKVQLGLQVYKVLPERTAQ